VGTETPASLAIAPIVTRPSWVVMTSQYGALRRVD
jgi:hypothetical protein